MDQVTFSRYSGETAKIIFAPLFIGLARDYFRDLDISISIVEPKEQPWITVAEGRADCGPGYIDYCASPAFHGRMKAVAVHEQFRPGHGITTLQARFILFNTRFIRERPGVGSRFLTAYLRGARDYCDAFDKGLGTAEMIDFLTRATGESNELLQTMKPVGFAPNGLIDMHRLESEVKILVRDGFFPQSIKLADVVDNQFAENALEDLGEFH